MKPIHFVPGGRTASADFGGALRDCPSAQLYGFVMAEAVKRVGLSSSDVEHMAIRNVIKPEPQYAYLARVAAIEAGQPIDNPARTLNRLCGTDVQSVTSAS